MLTVKFINFLLDLDEQIFFFTIESILIGTFLGILLFSATFMLHIFFMLFGYFETGKLNYY